MIIAKPEWFKRRKYMGWGAYPAKWQGWAYIGVVLAIVFAFQAIPYWNETTRIVFTIVALLFLGIDMIDVMVKMNKDERELIHEAKAERNALWAVIAVLCVGIAYQVASSAVRNTVEVDWVIVAALIVALVVKAGSNIYFDRKD